MSSSLRCSRQFSVFSSLQKQVRKHFFSFKDLAIYGALWLAKFQGDVLARPIFNKPPLQNEPVLFRQPVENFPNNNCQFLIRMRRRQAIGKDCFRNTSEVCVLTR